MKKKYAILPLLAMTVLSSCQQSYGEEITDKARVIELEKAISDKMNEPKGFEVHVKASMSDDRGEGNKNAYSWDLIYRGDKKDNMYLAGTVEIEAAGDKAKYKYALYSVEDPTYEKVCYIEMGSPDTAAKDIDVYAVRSDGYSSEGGLPGILAYPIALYDEVRDPYYIDQALIEYTGASPAKYYSKGDGSLTIERSSVEIWNGTRTSHTRMTYENYLLKDAVYESETTDETYKSSEKLELTYKTLFNYTVTLPSGWESLIREPRGTYY